MYQAPKFKAKLSSILRTPPTVRTIRPAAHSPDLLTQSHPREVTCRTTLIPPCTRLPPSHRNDQPVTGTSTCTVSCISSVFVTKKPTLSRLLADKETIQLDLTHNVSPCTTDNKKKTPKRYQTKPSQASSRFYAMR